MNKQHSLRAALLCGMAMNTKSGLMVPASESVIPGGPIEVYHNGELVELGPNLVPAVQRSYLVKAGYAGFAQISSWYIAPFSGAFDPLDSLTAANFNASLTEFTNYTEGTRPAWVQAAEATQQIVNSVTLATITVGAGGGTINGIVMSSTAAKGSAAGQIAAATRFGAPRVMLAGDTLQFRYAMQMNAAP